MAKSVVLTDKDLGASAIRKILDSFSEEKPYVKVGLLESAGQHSDSDASVATVATWQEFGTETIPERSFMRSTQLEKQSEISEFIGTEAVKVIEQKLKPTQLLDRIGLKVQSLLRQRIRSITQPPLSPATIAAKGSSKPLIDTGQMINSINYEKVEK